MKGSDIMDYLSLELTKEQQEIKDHWVEMVKEESGNSPFEMTALCNAIIFLEDHLKDDFDNGEDEISGSIVFEMEIDTDQQKKMSDLRKKNEKQERNFGASRYINLYEESIKEFKYKIKNKDIAIVYIIICLKKFKGKDIIEGYSEGKMKQKLINLLLLDILKYELCLRTK